MSFIRIDQQNFETVSLLVKPNISFVSSSNHISGSSYVAPIRSKCIKDLEAKIPVPDGNNGIPGFNMFGGDVEEYLKVAQNNKADGDTDIAGSLSSYLTKVNSGSHDVRYSKIIAIERVDHQLGSFPEGYQKENNIKNVLRKNIMPYYAHQYENSGFWYSNYHTLNFFTSASIQPPGNLSSTRIPTASCMLYPNISGSYDLPTSFCVNFWVNPRYSNNNVDYRAGTIMHISSSIAISLISGSNTDKYGAEEDFKIMVQLSSSADVPPSAVTAIPTLLTGANYPSLKVDHGDLIFTSSHTLKKNNWHNVTVQWGPNHNNKSGSIFIDDNETSFYAGNSSLGNTNSSNPRAGIDSSGRSALIIGNYFDGHGVTLTELFNASVEAQGVTALTQSVSSDPALNAVHFAHPLNAEIHDVKMFNKVLSEDERQNIKSNGVKNFDNLTFYVPPFFFPQTPVRDKLVTPYYNASDVGLAALDENASDIAAGITHVSSSAPFNLDMLYRVNGKLINLENFTREFVSGTFPRLLELVPKKIPKLVGYKADGYIFNSGSLVKRNMTILPNDNGLFKPNYDIYKLTTVTGSDRFLKHEDSERDYSIINIDRLFPSGGFPGHVLESTHMGTSTRLGLSYVGGYTGFAGTTFDGYVGSSPGSIATEKKLPGRYYSVLQRTRDISSNLVTIYNISNLYYGNRIHPGSFKLYEDNLTGSHGVVKITLKDNGRGSLYRADAETPHAEWNNVGNIYYDEGLAIVKSPHLIYFGKDKTDMSFKGEQNLHTMIINIPCYEWSFNSSSNETFTKVLPSTSSNDEDLSTLYITSVNIHDDNFNIIMKANFAQPIFKTEEDEFVIRLKEDF